MAPLQTYLLAIDQGTTNSRAIIFDHTGHLIAQDELTLQQFYPQDGWVEQNPNEMFLNTITCCRNVLLKANLRADDIAAIGITNQRETTILWDKHTGEAVYPAIVWQDRRTAAMCEVLKQDETFKQSISNKTGLLIDPYFSATKIIWLLEHVPGLKKRIARHDILFGTVDTYLLWRLTNGKSFFTDVTNAARTMLFNIKTLSWDQDILSYLNIPASLLPPVLDNTADFGFLDSKYLGKAIPIKGMAGDQQAATIGQACFQPGMIKATLGTGSFIVLNTGQHIVSSNQQLLSTIAYRINGQLAYGLEASIFCAGATIKWLRDELKFIHTAAESEMLTKTVNDNGGVFVIPAFTGLSAPYWDAEARGAILGLTRNSQPAHIVRAALESVAYQINALLKAMVIDSQTNLKTLRVDGGMTANNWLLQFLADILDMEVERPMCVETTALGAAYLAGLSIGLYQSLDDISGHWQQQASFKPRLNQEERLTKGWDRAVKRVLS